MIPRIVHVVGRTILRVSFVALLGFLVVMALYVSLGRQLVPMVSRYADQIEERLSSALSAHVTLRQVDGEWVRFSPVFVVHGLALRDREGDAASLTLERVVFSPDIPASLVQRRLVFGTTRVDALQLAFEEQSPGQWGLAGLVNADAATVSAEQVFDWLKSLSMFELDQAQVALHPLQGDMLMLDDVHVQFQSLGSRHVVMVRAESSSLAQPLLLQAELFGDHLTGLQGQVYFSVPQADYAAFTQVPQLQGLGVTSLQIQGELWADIDAGRIGGLTASVLGSATLDRQSAMQGLGQDAKFSITEFGVDWLQLEYTPESDIWQLNVEGLGFRLPGGVWPAGGLELTFEHDRNLRIHADVIELGLLGEMVSVLAPEGSLRTNFKAFNPRGRIHDTIFTADLADGAPVNLAMVTNVRDASISAHLGSPSVWGMNAYAELNLDLQSGFGEGYLEVDSNNMTMQLPSLFNDIWIYDHVNGRVGFQVDNSSDLRLRLASSVMELRSDVIDGRVQFSTDIQTGADRYINLELMVGILDADISQKNLYLPTAPRAPASIQGVMSWIDNAVLAGSGANSGLIFRGRVQGGATFPERTTQMFYHVADGTFRFDPQWPVLEDLHGYVVINNGEVDVRATAGRSLDIDFSSSVASVRSNPEGGRWLTVSGTGRGSAQQGLQYLQHSPVTQGLGENLATWRAEGDIDFGLELSIPLSIIGAQPDIRLELGFENNSLFIPEYGLFADELSGELIYSAAEGLHSQDMQTRVLGHRADIEIKSDGMRGVPEGTKVTVIGELPFEELAAWTGLPQIVAVLLTEAKGAAHYTAELKLPVYGQSAVSTSQSVPTLAIRSDLSGVALNYPPPFSKLAVEQSTLDLLLEFHPSSIQTSLQLAEIVQMSLRLNEGGVQNGLVYFGPSADGLRVRRLNATAPGVEVLGQIPELDYNAWAAVVGRLLDSMPEPVHRPASMLSGLQGSVAVALGRFSIFDEVFERMNVRLSRDQDVWRLVVASDAVAGDLVFPSAPEQPLLVNLEHLHLSRSINPETETQAEVELEQSLAEQEEVILDLQDLPPVEYILPRSDPLAGVDPRDFPDLEFSVGHLTMAGSDFGRWKFNLKSDNSGAHFSDLLVESRGLRIGSPEEPGEFRWIYDGDVHRSVLNASVFAADLGPVLSAYGYAPSIQSSSARFDARLHWDGSPAFFSALGLNGDIDLRVNNGRFQQRAGVANSALRLISIINFDAIIRRLRFSDDLARAGLAYDEIRGSVSLADGIVTINDRLQIVGPSSLFQIAGELDLEEETINADMYITLPVSDNIPWLGGLAVLNNLINWQLAIGVFLFDRIFGDQVDSLTSAHYTLQGPWEGLEPRLYQVFSGGGS